MPKPWYYESGQGNYFNEWTPVHLVAGIAGRLLLGDIVAPLVLHTLYELVESEIYPYEGRDRSMQNHIGDTAAFVAGELLAHAFKKTGP